MANLLGFQITRNNNDLGKPAEAKQAFTVASPDDGTTTISAGGYFGQYLDMEVTAKNDIDLIRRYREIAQHPECDMAIEDIINETIVSDERDASVSVSLDKLGVSDAIKGKVRDEFDEVLRLLNFDEKGHDIFRRWYVDGRIYFHKVIDPKSPRKGLTEIRYIDPRKIKKVREVAKKRDNKGKTRFFNLKQIEKLSKLRDILKKNDSITLAYEILSKNNSKNIHLNLSDSFEKKNDSNLNKQKLNKIRTISNNLKSLIN